MLTIISVFQRMHFPGYNLFSSLRIQSTRKLKAKCETIKNGNIDRPEPTSTAKASLHVALGYKGAHMFSRLRIALFHSLNVNKLKPRLINR